ncbi:sugar hydrolase [Xylariomycetidae sp. FL2044]|nr:sugar hydrolase [Xylariomycetidae sp. FL2044]
MIPYPSNVVHRAGTIDLPSIRPATAIDPSLPHEGYELQISAADGVRITGGSHAGVFYGRQTLRQLLPPSSLRQDRRDASSGPWTVPAVEVTDAPRFAWRGVMIDVARHFMPKHDVLRFIDLAAFHKLNVVHIHLTDDQGWRVPVPKWPKLTTVGCWRKRSMLGSTQHERYDARPHGGFYSVEDLREMVAFAAERHVTLLPEIDMPGHMQAAVAAYPELGNGAQVVDVREAWGISKHVLNMDDATIRFCQDVLDVVCDIFPGEYVGIGGDECPYDEWEASEGIQRRIAELGLKDEHDLFSWFAQQMVVYLRDKHNRRTYCWDEIISAFGKDVSSAPEDVAAQVRIAAWRGEGPISVAARRGFQVVACPDTSMYLDYRQSDDADEPTPVGNVLDLGRVYAFDPVPAGLSEEEARRVVGVQSNVWTEHMESPQRVEYMTYPRLCAVAEVAWGKQQQQQDDDAGFEGFQKRLEAEHLARLDALGVNYRPQSGPRPWDARPDAPGNPRDLREKLAKRKKLAEELDR